MIRIPVIDEKAQEVSVDADGRRVTLTLWVSDYSERVSISVAVDGDPVLIGRRIVAGSDLLKPFGFGIGGMFVWPLNVPPTLGALASGDCGLYLATEAEMADAALSA